MNLGSTFRLAIIVSVAFVGVRVADAGPDAHAPAQRYVCNVGYTLEECHQQMVVLKKALQKYPVRVLGEWSWVIVRSQDWKEILAVRGFNPDTPAFTYLPAKQTFFDEALVRHDSRRGMELEEAWHLSMEELLDLAVRHELGHAFCNKRDERQADRVAAALLRDSRRISCDIAAIPALNELTLCR